MGGGSSWCVVPHRVERGLNPRLQTEPVVKEDIGALQADDVLCRGFVVVNRHVGGADHFNVHEVPANRRNEFGDVVGRDHHGAVGIGGFTAYILRIKAASEAGENHHQACSQGALPRFAHGSSSCINYLVFPNN